MTVWVAQGSTSCILLSCLMALEMQHLQGTINESREQICRSMQRASRSCIRALDTLALQFDLSNAATDDASCHEADVKDTTWFIHDENISDEQYPIKGAVMGTDRLVLSQAMLCAALAHGAELQMKMANQAVRLLGPEASPENVRIETVGDAPM